MKYPLIPKSTSYLEPGHFWPIHLTNDIYACGIVISKLISSGNLETRCIYAGLLDWKGFEKPSAEIVNNKKIIKKGALHIKGISEILGQAESKELLAEPQDYSDDIVTMGYNVLNVLAEKHFG